MRRIGGHSQQKDYGDQIGEDPLLGIEKGGALSPYISTRSKRRLRREGLRERRR